MSNQRLRDLILAAKDASDEALSEAEARFELDTDTPADGNLEAVYNLLDDALGNLEEAYRDVT